MVSKFLLGTSETMDTRGIQLTGAYLPEALLFTYLIQIRSKQHPKIPFLELNPLGRKGKGRRFSLSLLFLNKQLKTNIPKRQLPDGKTLVPFTCQAFA